MKTNLCSFLRLIGGVVHVKSVDPYGICVWQIWMYRAYYYYWKMDLLLFSAWLVVQKKNDNNKKNNFISLNVLRSCFESLLLCFSPIILNWGRAHKSLSVTKSLATNMHSLKVVAENSFAQLIIYQWINDQRPSGVSNNDSE